MNIKNLEQQLLDAIKNNNLNDFKNDVIFFLKNIGESAPLTKLLLDSYLSFQNDYLTSKNKIITSVIIPCHNYGLYLRDAVLSVLHQTFPYFEIIIVNDGSEDNSHSVATKILSDFPDHHISYVNQPHSGIVQPRNRGVGMARGNYILPLDADDMIAPQFLEKTVAYLDSHPSHGYVSTKALFFGDVNKIWPRDDFHHINLFATNQQTNTTLYRKEMWEDIGGYDERMIHGYMDWEFWIRATKFGWIGHQLDEPLFFYRRKSNSVVMKAKKNDVEIKSQIMKLHPEVYLADLIDLTDPELHRKNWIPPRLIKKDALPKNRTRSSDSQDIPPSDGKISATQKLRILYVCHDFPPHKYAGAQLYAKHLAEEINSKELANIQILFPIVRRKDKNDYEIVSKNEDGLFIHQLYKPCVDEPNKVYDSIVYKKISNFLITEKFDLIHFHGLGQLSLAPIFSAHKLNIRSIITLHDYWFICDRWHMIKHDQSLCSGPDSIEKCAICFLEARGMDMKQINLALNYQSMRKSYMKKAFSIFAHRYAPSKFLADTFAKFGFSDIEVAPLGLSSLPLCPKRKTTNNPTKLGYAGQFIPRKGIDTLLQAIQILDDPSISLHIWGKPQDDPYGHDILKQIKDIPSITYHGPFNANDLEEIYSLIDLAIIPSRMENYPLTILEAFAHGTPVVATKVGGIPEIIANHCPDLLVDAGNSEQLATAIRTALRPETYTALCAKIPQVRSITQDAHDYITRYNNMLSHEHPIQRIRILFYFFKNVHIPILLPLYRALKAQNADVEIGFSYLPPSPQIRAGLLPDEVRIIEQAGVPIHPTPQEFKPDLTFIADSVYPWVEGCGQLVHVGHGVLSKGQYYTDTPTARREEFADLVCVPGKHHQAIMRRIISKPVVATGMCKLDDLFSGKINRASVIKQYGLPADYRYVLFAPTFNDELSAIPFVQDRIGKVLPDDRTLLIIKLHPSTKAEYKEMYRALPNRDKRIIFADELDITPFLALCDVMISDVSSAMMEFAALDKPVILFNNPNWTSYQNFNPADIEFQWRDIGVQVANLDEMREAVSLCLQTPGLHADKRKKYTDLLFANKRDGSAAERIVKVALSLVQTEQER